MDRKILGILLILGASLLWAIETIFAKLAYTNADALQTSAMRSIVVFLFGIIYILIGYKGNFTVQKKYLPQLFYIAIAATIGADLLYYYALTKIPVINAVLIGHLQPLFILLFGYFLLKEDRITTSDYLGIFIMLIAGLLVTTRTLANLSMLRIGTQWDLLLLLATVLWATTAIVARKYLITLPAGIIIFYRFLFSSLIFVLYFLLTGNGFTIHNQFQIYVGIAVAVGLILYYEGIKRIKAAQAGALEITTPFFAVAFGFLVLGETITVMQMVGLILLAVGVYFLSKKE